MCWPAAERANSSLERTVRRVALSASVACRERASASALPAFAARRVNSQVVMPTSDAVQMVR